MTTLDTDGRVQIGRDSETEVSLRTEGSVVANGVHVTAKEVDRLQGSLDKNLILERVIRLETGAMLDTDRLTLAPASTSRLFQVMEYPAVHNKFSHALKACVSKMVIASRPLSEPTDARLPGHVHTQPRRYACSELHTAKLPRRRGSFWTHTLRMAPILLFFPLRTPVSWGGTHCRI